MSAVPRGPVLALLGDPPRLVDPVVPVVLADDPGLLRGESVFETLRLARGRPAFLAAHLDRLARSAARLDLDLPGGWAELAHLAAGEWGQGDGMLRLVWTRGGTGFALAGPIPDIVLAQRERGVRVVTLTLGVPAGLRAQAPWLLGGVKSTSYAVNMAAQRAAAALGADDAVFLSSDGEVLEAPTSSVAWVSAGVLVTPAPAVGILPGTTLAVVLAGAAELGLAVEVRRAGVAELLGAEEAFLLSSVRGVAPVVSIDGAPLARGRWGEVSASFEKRVMDDVAGAP